MGKILDILSTMAGGVPSAVAQLGSAAIGAIGQSSSNKRYLQGVRETNAANLDIAERNNAAELARQREMNAWNFAQWNRENVYNSPAMQRNRLLMAGINGYSGSSGEAAQLTASQGNAFQQARMRPAQQMESPLSSISRGVGGAVDSFLDAQSKSAAIKQQNIQNQLGAIDVQMKLSKEIASLNKTIAETEKLVKDGKLTDVELDRLKFQRDTQVELYSKVLRQMDDEHDNSVRLQNHLESQTETEYVRAQSLSESIQRDWQIARSQMKRWSVENAVDWFNSQTGRMEAVTGRMDVGIRSNVSQAEIKHLAQLTKLAAEEYNQKHALFGLEKLKRSYDIRLDQMTLEEKTVAINMALMELEQAGIKNEAPLNWILKRVFGVDASDVISGALAAYFGYAVGKSNKGYVKHTETYHDARGHRVTKEGYYRPKSTK